jgi:DNA-binding NarL/FixJ family response regulator
VLLIDDHQVVREGLRALLREAGDIAVVAEAADGESGVACARAGGVDVVVMDVGLPGLGGVTATRRIVAACPEVRVVVLSMYDDAPTVEAAFQAGARGYVLKGGGIGPLCAAIRAAMRGEVYVGEGVPDYVPRLSGAAAAAGSAVPEALTAREQEVVQLIAAGCTAREAAARLGLKPKTVENHRARIMEKLGIHTTAGLVRYALRAGLAR